MTRTFTVYQVRGKGSARTFWIKDKFGHPIKPVTTKHPKTRAYEALVQEAYLAEYRGQPPFDGPVNLRLEIYLPVPKSYSKKKRLECLSNSRGGLPTKKPDCSNVLKSIEDSMNGVGFVDDKQIVNVSIIKRYAENEKVTVEITEIE